MRGASPGGWSIVEIRDGSNNVYQQVYHGTQYIDEIVAMRLEKGYAVVYQDANWNTIATCDLAGRTLERVFTTPYGSPIIEPETFFGDYDGDGDVDATDDASLGSGQTCWGTPTGACRVFDFNSDGTLDSSDETVMTALVAAASTNRRHEGRTESPTEARLWHQGLLHDDETSIYCNRFRAHKPELSRFLERDPLGTALLRIPVSTMFAEAYLYHYIAQNPLNRLDPRGLRVCSSWAPTRSGFWIDSATRISFGNGVECNWRYCDEYVKTCACICPPKNKTFYCYDCCSTLVRTVCQTPPAGPPVGMSLETFCVVTPSCQPTAGAPCTLGGFCPHPIPWWQCL